MGGALEEHYSYLSDAVRAERFQQAIGKAVNAADTVADIGCGFGVLGLYCLKAGASHVWGIDETVAIEIARESMERAGFADRYTCLHGSSFRAVLPERVDIVICDHVGYFGFDYGIIKAVDDARRRFLKPGGKVVPQQIVLQLAATQSAATRAAAESWASAPIPEEYRWLRAHGTNSKHAHDFAAVDIASAPAELGRIDLRSDSPDHLAFSTLLDIGRTGELDGLAGWFACELFDDVWMTNSPLAPNRIKRSQVFLPFADVLSVETGDVVEVNVSVRHREMVIAWNAKVLRTGQSTRQSTWASTILDPRDRVPSAARVPTLSAIGEARRALLAHVDGGTSNAEIEQAMLREFPDLFPSADEVSRFVHAELNRNTG